MASQDNFYTSSPTVVLPQHPDQYFGNSHYGQPADGFNNPFPSDGNVLPTAGALAGRKRCRDDVHAPDDDGDVRDDQSTAASAGSEPRGNPIHGPGGTPIYPDEPGYAAAAEAQGMMVDDARPQFAHLKRPSINSRKSQRTDRGRSGSDELGNLVLPHNMRETCNEPLIDEATRMLGISWTRMDGTEGLLISKGAYEKWITKHYLQLKDVTVWFENSAIPAYLVVAFNSYSGEQGFYLFSNDLTEARLVTTEPSQLLPRLQMLPALHLAAPGGHIRAETDPITVAQNEINDIQSDEYEMPEPVGICAAHSMEMD